MATKPTWRTFIQPQRFSQPVVAIRYFVACALLLFVIVVVGSGPTFASPDQGRTPRPTSSGLTQTAFAQNIHSTATASVNKIGPTLTAISQQVHSTSTAFVAKVQPTLTALALNFNLTSTIPAADAAAAISSYASSVLGTPVTVTKAGGVDGDFSINLPQPTESANAESDAINLAVTSYLASLKGGDAFLSYGSGSISGNVSSDVQDHSLGIYSLTVPTSGTLNAPTALSLAKSTFPSIAALPYTAYTVPSGYAWYASTSVSVIDPKTRQVTTSTESVILYVLPGTQGKASVTVSVGRGDFATLLSLGK
jgi:hypothetical protein